jgi:PTS system nitrogen regulatory IIA component
MQLTVHEAAELLNVDDRNVLRWIKKEGLPAHKVNEVYRINRIDLLEWATEHRMKLSPEIFARLESAQEPLPRISEALEAGGIHYGIAGGDQQTVLRNIVGLVKLPPEADREFLLQVLLAREALGTTAIGDGIAIPHVRNPILLHGVRPTITLTFLAQPIDFKAIDGKPVDILFTLITPTPRVHLHILSKLAYLLRDTRLQAVLKRRGAAAEIMATIREIETELAV